MIKSKRGQFYLVAAIVIISLILGFVNVSNYVSQNQEVSKVYDLGEEIGIEGANILDYGTLTGDDYLEEFIEQYSDYEGNVYFIYGNSEDINIVAYSDLEETIEVQPKGHDWIELGDPAPFNEEGEKWSYSSTQEPAEKVQITIEDSRTYPFRIKEGENFYFILQIEIEGEEIVSVG